MALNDNATLVVGAGNFFTSVVGTALPTDLTAPGVDWVNIGHTSLQDIFGITSDGGDKTVLGTLQSAALRTTYSSRTETFALTVQQFDAATLKLYFGSNAVVNADGSLGVPGSPAATESAFLAVFTDGTNHFAFYAPKAEILRGDDMSLSDTESLAGLPLSITPINYNSNSWAYAVTPLA